MKNISDYYQYDLSPTDKKEDLSIHIFNLGFEERCTAYPEFIASKKNLKGKHLCLSTSNDRLSDFLIDSKGENKKKIESLFPTIEFDSITDIIPKLSSFIDRFEKIYIDTSTLPRGYIFKLLNFLLEKGSFKSKRVFLIYTFPKSYVYDKLQ